MLAFGTVVLGNPFWGVWISTGLMCATISWMLQAWMPARWAVLGGLFAILRFATFGYWPNSYWGGAWAATGGALLLGGVPRIKRSQRIRDALFLALGLAILANTRPYEGFILGLTVAMALFAWMLGKERPPLRISFLRVILPVVCCMVLVGAAMAYYNRRVTGSPLLMAYQIERKAYFVAPYFIWQSLSPEPVYHHELIRDIYANRLPQGYNLSRSLAGVLMKVLQIWKFYLGPLLTLPLVLGLLTLRSGFRWRDFTSRTRFLVLVCGISALGFMVEVFFEAHYAAPITSLIVALVLLSMSQLQSWQVRGLPPALFPLPTIPAISLLMFPLP